MTLVTSLCLAGLAVGALMCLVRLALGPSVPDRIITLDALLFLVASGIAVLAARTGEGTYLGILVVVSLLSFVGTVTTARFVERRGA